MKAAYLSLDLRSLALWRIGLGGLVLLDILLRSRDLQAFHGDQGVLSRQLALSQSWLGDPYYLYLATGTTPGLLVLFGLGAAAATCLMIGFHSRLAGFATWYFLVSVQLRNPMVLDGGDELLRVLLFWSPFLPLGARWSIDAHRHPHWSALPNSYRSIATVAVYVQFALFYLFAALLKTGEEWLRTGDALYYVLSIDQFTTTLGRQLLDYPEQLRLLTWAALGLEFLLPVLLLLPPRVPFARAAFLALAAGFHLAIASLLHFGIFMLIAIVCLSVFIPGQWWPEEEGAGEPARGEPPAGYRLSRPARMGAGFMIFYLFYVNLYSIGNAHKLSPWAYRVALYTYQHQHWHFFAPSPFRQDGFFRLEIVTPQGELDALQVAPLGEDGRPRLGSARFRNQRWRRWLQNLLQIDVEDNRGWRASTLDYLAREWSSRHPEAEVEAVRLVFMEEMTPPPGETPGLNRIVLAERVGPVAKQER